MLVQEDVGIAVDGPQGRAEVVRDGIGERLEFAVGRGEVGGPLLDALLEFGIEPAVLVLGLFEPGDVVADAEDAAVGAVGVDNGAVVQAT